MNDSRKIQILRGLGEFATKFSIKLSVGWGVFFLPWYKVIIYAYIYYMDSCEAMIGGTYVIMYLHLQIDTFLTKFRYAQSIPSLFILWQPVCTSI